MSPTWSPDGQQIAFLSNRAEGWDLYVMPSSGGPARRLTSGATADDPAWSPDGRWIACERNHHIVIVASDGSQQRVLVRHGAHPTWSPDGRLAFVRDHDLHIRERDGSERLFVRDADQPHWSPNGAQIAFVRRGIWTVDVAADDLLQRTHDPADESPALAADGDIIVVRRARLAIVHPDGDFSDLPHLPFPAGAPAPHPTMLDQVAFHLHDGGNWDIVTASLERGEVRPLTRATWTSWNARR